MNEESVKVKPLLEELTDWNDFAKDIDETQFLKKLAVVHPSKIWRMVQSGTFRLALSDESGYKKVILDITNADTFALGAVFKCLGRNCTRRYFVFAP